MVTTTHQSSAYNAPSRFSSDAALELETQLVRQTQQELRQTVSEIAELAQQPIEFADFINGFLPRVASATMATGVCIWRHKEDWTLVGEYHFPDSLLETSKPQQAVRDLPKQPTTSKPNRSNPAAKQSIRSPSEFGIDLNDAQVADTIRSKDDDASSLFHVRYASRDEFKQPSDEHRLLLDRIAQERQPILIPPRSVTVAGDRPSNPIDETIIVAPAPFESHQESFWLEIVLRPAGGPATQRGFLRFAAQMADLLADYLKSSRLRTLERDQSLFTESGKLLDDISSTQNHARSLRKLMETVRGLSSADQVFLLNQSSGRWSVCAASGLDQVDRKSEGHQALTAIAHAFYSADSRSIKSWCAASATSKQAASEKSNSEFERTMAQHATTLAAEQIDWLRLDQCTSQLGSATGILVLWSQPIQSHVNPKLAAVARIVLDTVSPNWWQRQRFLESPQTALSKVTRPWSWSRPSRVIIASLFATAILMLPFPLNVTTMATVHPSATQTVYAPSNAIVRSIPVDYGQPVQAGDVLVEMEDAKLAAAFDETLGELVTKEHRLEEVQAILRRGETETSAKRDQLEIESQSLVEQIAICQDRIAVLNLQKESLTVRSAMAGIVGTWDVRKLLADRPVQAGQMLMNVYDPKQAWNIEAEFDERDIASLQRSLRTNSSPSIAIQFTSHPDRVVQAAFVSIDEQAYADADSGKSVVKARFQIDANQMPMKNLGAAARVHVVTGTSPLGWVLMRDFVLSTWAKMRMWL